MFDKTKEKIIKILYNSPLERPINLVLRYSPIVKKIKKISKGNEKLKVLEIGSGSIGITRFYRGKVIGIDIVKERYTNPRLKFIKGTATLLPFKDKSFDVVISVDTLEHLSRKDQKRMVLEAYRVAKKYVLFTYPTGFSKHDWKIIKTWKKSHLTESLKEHLKGGTPKGDEIQKNLKGQKYLIEINHGTHPRLSYCLSYLEQNIITKVLSRTVFKIFLPILKILPKDKKRRYFFVEKVS